MLLNEVKLRDVKWEMPNFEYEWEEGVNYLNHPTMNFWNSKEQFLKLMAIGAIGDLKRSTLNQIDNYTPAAKDWDTLEADKRQRAEQQFKDGCVELPIVLILPSQELYLLGGNTRLNYAQNNGFQPKAWMVNLKKGLASLNEGSMKRSDPIISGEDTEPAKKPEVKPKKSAHLMRIATLAKSAGVSNEKAADAWAQATKSVDPRLTDKIKFSKITAKTKEILGI